MGDAEEQLVVGVEYTGTQALTAFGDQLAGLGGDIQAALSKLNTAGNKTVMERMGQQWGEALARQALAAVNLTFARGLPGLNMNDLFGGQGGLAASIVRNAGVPERNVRQFAEMRRAVEQIQAQYQGSLTPGRQGAIGLAAGRILSVGSGESRSAAAARLGVSPSVLARVESQYGQLFDSLAAAAEAHRQEASSAKAAAAAEAIATGRRPSTPSPSTTPGSGPAGTWTADDYARSYGLSSAPPWSQRLVSKVRLGAQTQWQAEDQRARITLAQDRRDTLMRQELERQDALRARMQQSPKQQFMAGFGADGRSPYEMVGQTARISLFYGTAYRALTLLQQGLQQSATETLDYENELTNLSIVLNRSKDSVSGLASSLGDIAVAAGYAPSQGAGLGAKALGLYGKTNATPAEQERTIQLSVQTATQMARVSGADPAMVQTQMAGTLRSLGWGIERITDLADEVTYIARQTGQTQTELLGAVSNIATLGTQAGFTPEQLAALVAQVGTTTGQNPEATAGQFRQLLSRTAPAIAAAATPIVGVDLSGMNLEQIFATVSKLSLSVDQMNRFASLFGKGGSQQVATILTQQYGAVQGLATGAQGAQGYAQNAFDKAMTSARNQFAEFSAVILQFGKDLIETGVADWIMLVLAAVENVVRVGDDLLRTLDVVPRGVRSVVLALGELYLAARAFQAFTGSKAIAGVLGNTVAGRATAAAGTSFLSRAAVSITNPAQLGKEIATGMRSLFGANSILRLSGDARTVAQGALNPSLLTRAQGATGLSTLGLGVAAGGVLLAGYTASQAYQQDQANTALVEQARIASQSAQTSKDMREAAAQARNAASDIEKTRLGGLKVGDVTNLVPALINQITQRGNLAEANRLAQFNDQRATALEQAMATSANPRDKWFSGDFSADGINAALQSMSDAGLSAAQRVQILTTALHDMASGANKAADVVAVIDENQRQAAIGGIVSGIFGGLNRAEVGRQASANAQYNNSWQNAIGLPALNTSDAMRAAKGDAAALRLSGDQQKSLNDFLTQKLGNDLQTFLKDGVITKDEQRQVVAAAQRDAASWFDSNGLTLSDTAKSDLNTWVATEVAKSLKAWSPAEIQGDPMGFVNALIPQLDQSAQDLQNSGASQQAAMGNEVRQLMASRADALTTVLADGELSDADWNAIKQFDQKIADLRAQIAQAQIAEAQAYASLIQARAGARAAALTPGNVLGQLAAQQQAIDAQTRVAQQQIAQAQLQLSQSAQFLTPSNGAAAQGLAGADLSALYSAQAAQAQAQQAQAEHDAQVAAENLAIQQNRRSASVDPRDSLGTASVAIANAAASMNSLSTGSSQYWAAVQQYHQAAQQYSQAQVQLANAAATAALGANRSDIDRATLDVANAQRTLGAQLAGTQGYYDALTQLRQTQASLAQAQLTQVDRIAKLGSDLTDPVAQANLEVQRVQRQLAADIASGQGSDITSQDRVDLVGAQNSAEAALFQQRLSDVQTANDLGRITESAYMSYLQSEHDRLSAIANRTRQQQEELNQVDQLMKSAAEQINGQFNIGDIKLPTLYEVRRAIASGAPTQVADYSNSNNTAYINGVDFAAVIQWLQTYLGSGAQLVTSTTPVRV